MVWKKICSNAQLLEKIKQTSNEEVESTLQENVKLCHAVDSTGSSLLHYAAEYGNEAIVKYLINLRSNVNLQNNDGNTPLLLATKRQHVETIKILLDSHASVFIRNNEDVSALQVAVQATKVNDEVVKLFLKQMSNKCSSNAVEIARKLMEINCPLYIAVHVQNAQVIRLMIKKGSPMNAQDPISGKSALHVAVENLDSESVCKLVTLGADLSARDVYEKIPLAMLNDFSKPDELFNIVENIMWVENEVLISCDNSGSMQICPLLQNGTSGAIKTILCDFDFKNVVTDKNGQNIIHYMAKNRNWYVNRIIDENISLKKWDVNARDENGFTALHIAMSVGNSSFVKYLIKNGANVNLEANEFVCPFIQVVDEKSEEKDRFEDRLNCVKILLENNADPNILLSQYFRIYNAKSEIDRDYFVLELVLVYLAMWEADNRPTYNDDIMWKINLYPKLKWFFDICVSELNRMKCDVLYRNMTLYDLFVMNDNVPFIIFSRIWSWDLDCKIIKYRSIFTYHEVLQNRARSIESTEGMALQILFFIFVVTVTIYMKYMYY